MFKGGRSSFHCQCRFDNGPHGGGTKIPFALILFIDHFGLAPQ